MLRKLLGFLLAAAIFGIPVYSFLPNSADVPHAIEIPRLLLEALVASALLGTAPFWKINTRHYAIFYGMAAGPAIALTFDIVIFHMNAKDILPMVIIAQVIAAMIAGVISFDLLRTAKIPNRKRRKMLPHLNSSRHFRVR